MKNLQLYVSKTFEDLTKDRIALYFMTSLAVSVKNIYGNIGKLHYRHIMAMGPAMACAKFVPTDPLNKFEMYSMECQFLRTLAWHINPPTAFNFLAELMNLIAWDARLSPQRLKQVGRISRYLCELSVGQYSFVYLKPSSVAVAAIVYAFDAVGGCEPTKVDFVATVGCVGIEVTKNWQEISLCHCLLKAMYLEGNGHSYFVSSAKAEVQTRPITTVDAHPNTSIPQAHFLERENSFEFDDFSEDDSSI